MSSEPWIDLPEDADALEVTAAADGVYVGVAVFNDAGGLLEEHTYAVGPEAEREVDA